ncbi:hypothetical protein H5V45_10200 [Nocardioides sp. KIGAM211]|uniref:Uncharacterized protein n=1 Tax=Nocardioides luti TaxID=2761101 RepID=A0A7X0RG50_9ACTN|nr:hypothetical protein [Nocardioides luti]MBB6627691.1 hypothetical protein [Nocardioides luti]
MYGDTSVIRALARDLREQAADIRTEADRLVGQADAVHWKGLAADAMRHRTRERAAALRRSAGLHEDAADALDHHAHEVDRLKDLIAAIERKVHGLIEGARDRLADLGHGLVDGLRKVLPDAGDQLLDRFVPPPPGNKAWLDVDVPGLGR